MADITQMLRGFQTFRSAYFAQNTRIYTDLVENGQQPKVLVIACSDSRVDPAILFQTEPGELFMVRNVANLVPPYEPDGHYHGTSAAIEYAVRHLRVEHIVVLGHSHCGGIHALCHGDSTADSEFLTQWISLAQHIIPATEAMDDEGRTAEQAAIVHSVDNLRTFPWVATAEHSGALTLHGWWFDMESGTLWGLDTATGHFGEITPETIG